MITVFGIRLKGKVIPLTKVRKFLCSSCKKEASFVRMRERRFFHLYFISLIPIEKEEEVIQCGNCKTLYRLPDNWDFDAEITEANIVEKYFQAIGK